MPYALLQIRGPLSGSLFVRVRFNGMGFCMKQHSYLLVLSVFTRDFLQFSIAFSKACSKPNMETMMFSPLVNGVYFIVITKKNPIGNRNSPIMDPITKRGVANAFEPRM